MTRAKHVLSEVEGTQSTPRGSLSFRPKGEIFLRSLTFVRDDGAWPVTWRLGDLARVNPRFHELPPFGEFAQTTQTFKYSNTHFFPDYAGKKRFAYRRTAGFDSLST